MSHGHPPPAGVLDYGMPVGMGPDFFTQMNTDPADTLSLLDNSFFLNFDGTMAMPLDPTGPLPHYYAAPPLQHPQHHHQQHHHPQHQQHQPHQPHHHPTPSPGAALGVGGGCGSAAGCGGVPDQTPFSPDEAIARSMPVPGRPHRGSLSLAAAGSVSNHQDMLSEFTSQHDWAARVMPEIPDVLHMLDPDGTIRQVSPSAELLTGYRPSELQDRPMRDLLHPDDVAVFTSELNESVATGLPLRAYYRLRKKNGQFTLFEAVGHVQLAEPAFSPTPEAPAPFCQAVFLSARPYPTKTAALLDSFLEHKMENERLKRKIAELQREEQEETEEAERAWAQQQQQQQQQLLFQQQQQDPAAHSPTHRMSISIGGTIPFPPLPDSLPTPLDRRASLDPTALETATATTTTATARRPSANASHLDTIELLTGLRYQEGERSRGITTGGAAVGAGLVMLAGGEVVNGGVSGGVEREREREREREQRQGEKKKKVKVAEEYVCTDCGTLESPEWRKGPNGPKTLCNACGLRWAKKEKKKSASQSSVGSLDLHVPGGEVAG